jgi:hypothetical protein
MDRVDGAERTVEPARSRVVRGALMVAGCAFVGLGVAGIFLPVLPTTPFLLLAAACFVRSSARLHRWLMGHPRLGPYVRGFVGRAGMPARAKRNTILTLWIVMPLSAAIVVWRGGPPAMRIAIVALLLAVAMGVTRYVRGLPTVEAAPGTDGDA